MTGKLAARPELDRALSYLREGDVFVITRMSRAMRSLKHMIDLAEQLRERNIGLVVLKQDIDTTSAQGRLVFHIFAAMDEFQRELIVEGTKEGLAAAKARGKLGGRKPSYTDTRRRRPGPPRQGRADGRGDRARHRRQPGHSLQDADQQGYGGRVMHRASHRPLGCASVHDLVAAMPGMSKSMALRAAGLPVHGPGSGRELNRAIAAGLILVEHEQVNLCALFASEHDRRWWVLRKELCRRARQRGASRRSGRAGRSHGHGRRARERRVGQPGHLARGLAACLPPPGNSLARLTMAYSGRPRI